MSALGVHMIDIGCQTPWVLAQISVDDIRRASVFCFFFLRFCNVFGIHELAKSASWFCMVLQFFRF